MVWCSSRVSETRAIYSVTLDDFSAVDAWWAQFANIIDPTGVSCPTRHTKDGTVLGPSFSDGMVLEVALRFGAAFGQPAGVNG